VVDWQQNDGSGSAVAALRATVVAAWRRRWGGSYYVFSDINILFQMQYMFL
jgi:hypothetical protein